MDNSTHQAARQCSAEVLNARTIRYDPPRSEDYVHRPVLGKDAPLLSFGLNPASKTSTLQPSLDRLLAGQR